MKKKQTILRAISIVLCLVMLYSALQIGVNAGASSVGGVEEPEEYTLKLISSNVSGIPIAGTFQGDSNWGENRKSRAIGAIFNGMDTDFVGTQEDFNYHKGLAETMTTFTWQTYSSGGLTAGDGINLFAKHPFYNVSRVKWDKLYGVISGLNDGISQKGFLYCVAEIPGGVYIDLYVVHIDAGTDPRSLEARADNFRQLAEHINARTEDRAVIVIGDFNCRLSRERGTGMYDQLIAGAGLRDTWVEVHNGGNYIYTDDESWTDPGVESVDRVMFKNGGGVEFTAESIENIQLLNEKGKTLTDHLTAYGVLRYTITDPPANTEELVEEPPPTMLEAFRKEVVYTLQAIWLLITSLDELLYMFDLFLIDDLGMENGIFYLK